MRVVQPHSLRQKLADIGSQFLLFALFLVGLGLVGGAWAQQAPKPAVDVVLTQARVELVDGKERSTPADKFSPGDVVEYEATYKNNGSTAVRGLKATLPIGDGLIYVPQSAWPRGAKTLAATKDGKYAAEPLMRAPKGGGKSEPVPYDEYASVRWEIDRLEPGASVKVRARARLAPVPQAEAHAGAAHLSKAPLEAGSAEASSMPK